MSEEKQEQVEALREDLKRLPGVTESKILVEVYKQFGESTIVIVEEFSPSGEESDLFAGYGRSIDESVRSALDKRKEDQEASSNN